nr:VanW family protein [uncultured Peptostreptococcus sp.]
MNVLKNKKLVIPVAVLLGLLVVGTGALSIQIGSDKILKGINIANVDLGGMTKAQAMAKLESLDKLKNIKMYYENQSWNISANEVDLKINYKDSIDAAYNYNRKSLFITNLARTLKADFGGKVALDLSMTYSDSKLKESLKQVKSKLDSQVKDASLDYDYRTKKMSIIPEESGKTVDLDASFKKTIKNLASDKFESEMVVKLEKAKFTREDLKGIDSLLAAYSTVYGGMTSRSYNIEKSTRDSSGVVLKPGQVYSFNGLTGEKTIARGYKPAPVIESGKLVMGIGGGVCQTSSTIFNAALLSGMEITNRRSHTIPSDYVNMGRDATVFDGDPGQDLKFKNPFKHKVYIKNYIYGNKVISEVYGSSSDHMNIDITTQVLGSHAGGSKTVVDPSLPAGKKVVEKPARPGYTVVTYRQYKSADGSLIKSEKIGYSNYPGQSGIVRVGGQQQQNPKIQQLNPSQHKTQGGSYTGALGVGNNR